MRDKIYIIFFCSVGNCANRMCEMVIYIYFFLSRDGVLIYKSFKGNIYYLFFKYDPLIGERGIIDNKISTRSRTLPIIYLTYYYYFQCHYYPEYFHHLVMLLFKTNVLFLPHLS